MAPPPVFIQVPRQMLLVRGSTFGLCTSVPPRFQFWKASWMGCPPMLNWTYHKPTMEEWIVPSAGEAVASCLPTSEITIAFPAAIAARLSPQEANAPGLSPMVTAAHSTSFVQLSANIVFIIDLLLNFEHFEPGCESLVPPSPRSRPYLSLARQFPAMQTGSPPLHFHNTA